MHIKMIPTLLVAVILVAYSSAADECTGATLLYSPMKVYRFTHPLSYTTSVGPAGSMFKDAWYRVDILQLSSFTFYGESSAWTLYRSLGCDFLNISSKVAETGSSIPLLLTTGTYFLRVGTLTASPTIAPVYEYAFSASNDYPVIGGVKTATVVAIPDGGSRVDIITPKFHYLTADVDGRNLNAENILWDSSWYLIKLPPLDNLPVTVLLHDLTAPAGDNYASIVMNFYKTPDQSAPSGKVATYNSVIFTELMNTKKQSSFFLQIGRTTRCTYITNYNLTVIISQHQEAPLTSSALTSSAITSASITTSSIPVVPITSSAVTSASEPAPAPVPSPPVSPPSVYNFCMNKTWPNMNRNFGYFCIDDTSFYRCDTSNRYSAFMKCSDHRRCRCQNGEECSDNGQRSPCEDFF